MKHSSRYQRVRRNRRHCAIGALIFLFVGVWSLSAERAGVSWIAFTSCAIYIMALGSAP